MDFTALIQSYDRTWAIFYCDPPYLNAENMYIAKFEKEDHEKLAGILRIIKGRLILTYNDHPDIWRLYEGLQFKQIEGRYSIQRKDRWVSFGELFITNFEPQKPSN